jgi:3-deoxy-manno-octulosonate cytidylyltransferase (CMP-KDO synthetase)
MKIIAVIPARYASTRFPGKPLADLCGKPMIWWVYNQVKKVSRIDEVYVATDDERIADVCNNYGFSVIMTSANHNTSTERVNEVAEKVDADIYICINGDEPLISPKVIEAIIPESADNFYAANLMTAINESSEVIDNTNIKVVTDSCGFALFMSRSPIPYPKASLKYKYYKHLGVLAYTKEALDFVANTPKGFNERIEDINELRFIENQKQLYMVEVDASSISVDTPKDLIEVREIMQKEKIT